MTVGRGERPTLRIGGGTGFEIDGGACGCRASANGEAFSAEANDAALEIGKLLATPVIVKAEHALGGTRAERGARSTGANVRVVLRVVDEEFPILVRNARRKVRRQHDRVVPPMHDP